MSKFLLAFLFLLPCILCAQAEQKTEGKQNAEWRFFTAFSYSLDTEETGKNWSALGLGFAHRFRSGKKIAAKLDFSYREWTSEDLRVFPLYLGPDLKLPLAQKATLDLAVGAGTNLTIGNDFGFFGAAAMLKADMTLLPNNKLAVFGGVALHFVHIGHPSEFQFFDLRVGIKL